MDCDEAKGQCKALCCKVLPFSIRANLTEDLVRYYNMREDVYLKHIGKHRYIIFVKCQCKNLGKDLRCKIYETRPECCKEAYIENKSSSIFMPHCIYKPGLLSIKITPEEAEDAGMFKW